VSDAADLLPDDDSFVQTAIQGLRVPTHLPDFWDQLAAHLDDAFDEMTAEGRMAALVVVPDLAVPEPSPHHVEDPWPEPEHEPQPAAAAAPVSDPGFDLFGPVDEPVYEDDDEYEEDPADAAAAYDPAYDEPTRPVATAPRHRRDPLQARRSQVFVAAPTGGAPAPRRLAAAAQVHQDSAVVPMSLRRASNLVLLALAILAAVMAIVAGLTLVHQRSVAGPSTPSEHAAQVQGQPAPTPPDLAA
jgi:hypothetical protein